VQIRGLRASGPYALTRCRSFAVSVIGRLPQPCRRLDGVAVPFALRWAGRDPAHGSSVVLTFVTDGAGFFMFLGLATLFLV